MPKIKSKTGKATKRSGVRPTDLIFAHVFEFVHREVPLLHSGQHWRGQCTELPQRVSPAPQTLVNHFTQVQQAVGHGRPALPQSDLKQSPHDTSSILHKKTKRLSITQSRYDGALGLHRGHIHTADKYDCCSSCSESDRYILQPTSCFNLNCFLTSWL